jgi:hypothetical protein
MRLDGILNHRPNDMILFQKTEHFWELKSNHEWEWPTVVLSNWNRNSTIRVERTLNSKGSSKIKGNVTVDFSGWDVFFKVFSAFSAGVLNDYFIIPGTSTDLHECSHISYHPLPRGCWWDACCGFNKKNYLYRGIPSSIFFFLYKRLDINYIPTT